jgi:hypothetical protein
MIEAEAQSRLGSENAFVDFYCPGCKQAVRTYFRTGVVSRGEVATELVFVVEFKNPG